jgi:hypothetical protein
MAGILAPVLSFCIVIEAILRLVVCEEIGEIREVAVAEFRTARANMTAGVEKKLEVRLNREWHASVPTYLPTYLPN